MQKLEIWVVGGDGRQRRLAALLAENGHRVHMAALGEEGAWTGLGRADCVVLPLPVCREAGVLFAPLCERTIPLEQVLDAMRPGQLALGGQMDRETVMALRARGIRWRDYFAREELTVANAVPTAEGAIQLAMEHMPITVHGCRALVIGYGRIGRLLAARLRGLGAVVTAAVRRQEPLAWARAEGCRTLLLTQEDWTGEWDVVFNTVPAVLLDRERLEQLRPDCLLIDVASAPGGMDRAAAAELGLEVIWGRGLPGKVAPETAAQALRQTISHILEEVPV